MKTWSLWLVMSVTCFLLSCVHLAPPVPPVADPASQDAKQLETLKTAEQREVLKAAGQRLDDTRAALDSGNLDEAEAGLQPLLDQGLFANEVNELRAGIRRAKDRIALEEGQKEADQRAFSEVGQRYTLPSTYGSTVTITGEPGPFTIPPGPMEAVFSRKVSLQVQNAGVKELVQALTQIEGLNIIADDAIEAKKTLTVDVRDAPLSEILSYVARNMGIAFNLGDNIVWVTASEETQGTGPKRRRVYSCVVVLPQGWALRITEPSRFCRRRSAGRARLKPVLHDAESCLSPPEPEKIGK